MIYFLLSFGKVINSILIFHVFLSLLSIVLVAIHNVISTFRFVSFAIAAFSRGKIYLFVVISLYLSIQWTYVLLEIVLLIISSFSIAINHLYTFHYEYLFYLHLSSKNFAFYTQWNIHYHYLNLNLNVSNVKF